MTADQFIRKMIELIISTRYGIGGGYIKSLSLTNLGDNYQVLPIRSLTTPFLRRSFLMACPLKYISLIMLPQALRSALHSFNDLLKNIFRALLKINADDSPIDLEGQRRYFSSEVYLKVQWGGWMTCNIRYLQN